MHKEDEEEEREGGGRGSRRRKRIQDKDDEDGHVNDEESGGRVGGKGAWEKTEERKENEEAEENEDDDEDREAQKEGEANGRIQCAGSRSGRKLSMTCRMRGKDFGAERTQQKEAACGAKETEKQRRWEERMR